MRKNGAHFANWLAAIIVFTTWCASAASYNPLAVPTNLFPATVKFTVHDAARQRDIPVLLYLPVEKSPAPVVLFSHGLGGSREGNAYMGQQWSARGYVAVFLQHPGSDTSVWQGKPPATRMAAMQQAANGKNFQLRVKDVPVVLDQLMIWNQSASNALTGRLDLKHIGMSGHSFGAVTTEAVSGESVPGLGQIYTDKRIQAAIAFSPSSPRNGKATLAAFGSVKIPWLLMTGTEDVAPIGHTDVASRLAVFPALPPGSKYELVLDKAEHSAFTDSALPGDHEARNPNHHRAILAISTAFWDAYLKNDPAARAWLNGGGPSSVLESKDRWQKK